MRCIERFVDDFGNVIVPGYLEHSVYMSRYYFFKGKF